MSLALALAMQAAIRSGGDRPVGTVPLPGALPGTIVGQKVSIQPVADCLAKRANKDTDRFLATPLMTQAEQERGRILLTNHSSCFGRTLTFGTPVSVLRGALAQQRLLATPATLDTFAHRPPGEVRRVRSADGRPFLVSYAACLATAQPGWTAALLHTPLSSAAERRTFLQFGEALKNCMPEDRAYHVDMPALRDEMAAVVDQMITQGGGA